MRINRIHKNGRTRHKRTAPISLSLTPSINLSGAGAPSPRTSLILTSNIEIGPTFDVRCSFLPTPQHPTILSILPINVNSPLRESSPQNPVSPSTRHPSPVTRHPAHFPLHPSPSPKSGQSMIEACLAMFIICLLFFGLFQISQLAAAREILHHAAARGTRAKTVGFNKFMVSKAIRVAVIPNAGKMISPEFTNEDPALREMVNTMNHGELWDAVLEDAEPSSLQYDLEIARIPEYMGSENQARANYILDYEDWHAIGWSTPRDDSSTVEISVSQQYPLRIPLHRTFYAGDFVNVNGRSSLENHHPLYIDDNNW